MFAKVPHLSPKVAFRNRILLERCAEGLGLPYVRLQATGFRHQELYVIVTLAKDTGSAFSRLSSACRVASDGLDTISLQYVCNDRLCSSTAEDEGRGEAARVPADGDPSYLDPRGVETWDRPFVRPAQHPAARVRGEPAYRVRYEWRDLYGHKGRNTQGPYLPAPRGGGISTCYGGSVVLFQGAEK